jgi:hypothetical protein
VWYFSPCDDDLEGSMALLPNIPLVSKEMAFRESFPSLFGANEPQLPTPYRLQEGTELIFSYDLGTTTQLAVTIERIQIIPEGKKTADYPIVKTDIDEAVVGDKRKRIEELPILTISMASIP